MRSAPARPVRACFVRSCCNVVVQEHNLRASPVQCNVRQALSSHITLHPSHFTSELFSSGFMSSHMSATFFLAMFMSSERSSSFLMRWTYFQPISALLHVSKVERNSCRFFYMPKGVDHKIFTILRSFMPSVDALHQIATASVNMLLPVKEIHAVQARQLLFSLRYTWSSRLLTAFSARTGTKGWRAYHGWPSWHFTKQIRQEVLTLSAMTLRTQAASACDKRHSAPAR